MKIIIGLGNPGVEYKQTRHNAGVMLVDKIYESKFMNYEYGFRRKKDIFVYDSDALVLVKTANVFMNESSKIIREALGNRDWVLENLYIAHDDLDIKLGEFKIQKGTGPKVHNGLLSVEQSLGTKDFWRVRIGIDNRKTPIDGETYVLQKFSGEERIILDKVLEDISNEIIKTTN